MYNLQPGTSDNYCFCTNISVVNQGNPRFRFSCCISEVKLHASSAAVELHIVAQAIICFCSLFLCFAKVYGHGSLSCHGQIDLCPSSKIKAEAIVFSRVRSRICTPPMTTRKDVGSSKTFKVDTHRKIFTQQDYASEFS